MAPPLLFRRRQESIFIRGREGGTTFSLLLLPLGVAFLLLLLLPILLLLLFATGNAGPSLPASGAIHIPPIGTEKDICLVISPGPWFTCLVGTISSYSMILKNPFFHVGNGVWRRRRLLLSSSPLAESEGGRGGPSYSGFAGKRHK